MVTLGRCVVAWLCLLTVAGCMRGEERAQPAERPALHYAVSLPASIQPRSLSSDCAANIEATVQVDEKPPVRMVRAEEGFNWSLTLKGMTPGNHRFSLEFSCVTPEYGRIVLAVAEKPAALVAGGNELVFSDELFISPDLDGDGISNLAEIESGTNPLPSSALHENPMVVRVRPADGSVAVDRFNEISITFGKEVLASTVTPSAFYLSVAGERIENPGRFSVSGNKAAIVLKKPLPLLAELTVTVTTAIKGVNKQSLLAEDVRWGFVTEDGRWQAPQVLAKGKSHQIPAVAVDDAGNIFVAWYDDSETDILSLEYDGDDGSWGERRREWDGVGYYYGVHSLTVAMFSDSLKEPKRTVAWSMGSPGGGYGYSYACTTAFRGTSDGTREPCFSNHSAEPNIVYLPNGDFAAVWVDLPARRANSGIPFGNVFGYFHSGYESSRTDGVSQPIESSIQTTVYYPTVIRDSNGNGIALWAERVGDEYTNVFANRFVNNAWQRSPTQLNTDHFDNGYSRLRPQAAADDQGNVIAIWYQANTEIWVNRFDAAAMSWGRAQRIHTASDKIQHLAIDMDSAGNAVAVWSDSSRIYAARFSMFRKHWGAPLLLGGGNGNEVADPLVKLDSVGNGMVVWSEYTDKGKTVSDVWVNRFSIAAGKWHGPAVIEDQAGKAINPKIAMMSSGDTFIAWENGGSIYLARFE